MNQATAWSAGGSVDSAVSARVLGRVLWLRTLLIAALMVAVFWPNLQRLWLKTNPFTGEANWAHSMFVPLIGLYYLYLNREALLSAKSDKPRSFPQRVLWVWLGLLAIPWGLLAFVWAYLPALFFDSRTGLRNTLMFTGPLLALSVAGGAAIWLAVRRRGDDSALNRLLGRLADSSAAWFGFYLMIWGMVLFAWAIWPGRNDFLKDLGMVVTLFGVVLMLCGWAVMRIAWFPVAFLVAAIPWPELFYSRVALPLQKGAASAAVATLQVTGVDAERVGTIIRIKHRDGAERQLNVAEACAGLKSLMTFIAIGAMIGFVSTSSRQMWQRVLITLSAIPIAIFANMFRVAGQGLLDHYVSQKLSESFAHQFAGVVMLAPAMLLMLLVAWVVDRMVVEEVETSGAGSGGRPSDLVIEIPRARRGGMTVTEAAPAGDVPSPAVARDPAARAAPAGGDAMAAAATRLAALRASRRRPADESAKDGAEGK